MIRAEALAYFSKEEINDLNESYENKLFVFKQFFIQKVPISKTFNAKLKKLKLLNDAFIALGGEFENSDSNIKLPIFSNNLNELYSQFNQTRNHIKLRMQHSDNGEDLHRLVLNYLGLMRSYVSEWSIVGIKDFEGVKVSVELDVMEMLKAIDNFNSKGYSSLEDIIHLDENDLLIQEAKRLYLWNKLDANV